MKLHLLLYTILFTLCCCAVVKPPSGGPKDTDAPVVLQQTPSTNTVNFSNNTIIYEFDEYIELNNFNQEVTVSPFLDPKEIKPLVKGKKLLITLPSNLLPQTTYTINFGESIRDITERNPIKNLSLTFSTGDYLDSLEIQGSILNREVISPSQDILIGLYSIADTITPTKDLPIYFIKTKNDTFSLSFLPNGTYQAFAFNDINNNYLYDSLTEHIAFTSSNIETLSHQDLNLTLFKEDFRKFSFSRPSAKDNIVTLSFNKGLQSINSAKPFFYDPITKTLQFYQLTPQEDLSFVVADSNNSIIDTTIVPLFSASKFIDSSYIMLQSTDYKEVILNKRLSIVTPHLISNLLIDSILIVCNSDTIDLNHPKIQYRIESNKLIIAPTNKSDTLSIYLPKKTIQSYSGHYNKAFKTSYVPLDNKLYGSIKGEITTTEKNYILYLYTSKNQLISTMYNPTSFSFPYLTPNTYKIVILIDKNNNKTFDTGKLGTREQAEHVITYDNPLIVKPNWDIGNINISF